MTQTDIFGYLYPNYKIRNPIRLIELFAGVGTQAMALRDLGVKFERWKTCEWDYHAILSYAAIHCADDKNDYSSALDDLALANSLYQLGISADGKSQMELASIKRLLEKKKRKIYNAIMASHNMVNIISATADDLKITDTDRYEYIMTYSFPCQDLSLAGRGKGMEKGSGTRSSLLWEVERILLELKERNELPQVLVMENVPEVIGAKNYQHFMEWYASLERMGYQSYYKLLNAKDYGVPQSRNRCFMVSILGDYNYTFREPMPLKRRLRDVLESEVDERYYLSDKATAYLLDNKDRGGMIRAKKVEFKDEDSILANTITTMQRGYSPFDNFIICDQRIRKLTPLECWRLMDYSDEDFYKAQAVSSNTQLYKQAGNGIVKAVLMAIFKEQIEQEEHMKPILDVCCGSRMFYFKKNNPLVHFNDVRDLSETLCDGRKLEIHPDTHWDFRHLPVVDNTYHMVVFDPPHLLKVGGTSWLAKKYGKLPEDWQSYLKQGFDECMRVLKPYGTLILKWNETDIKLTELLESLGTTPILGNRGRGNKTYWFVFMKEHHED